LIAAFLEKKLFKYKQYRVRLTLPVIFVARAWHAFARLMANIENKRSKVR